MPSEKSSFDSPLDVGWALADAKQHPLGRLNGKGLDSYKLVVLIGAKNRTGATYFQVFFQNTIGELSHQPVVTGLYNQGSYPSYNWIEIIHLLPEVSFTSEKQALDTSPNRLVQRLLRYLADLIPPGGHMMVEYDSPGQQDTARSLALGIPPIATPLGYILFSVGCGAGIKDWYFAEGGNEGPRKLQGYKALNSQQAQLQARKAVRDLTSFLGRLPSAGGSEWERAARYRALVMLTKFKQPNN
jgi:hypothetical protein